MTKNIIPKEGFDLGVFLQKSGEKPEKLYPYRSFDISDRCPGISERMLAQVHIANSSHGLVAIVHLPDYEGSCGGVRADFIVAELEREVHAHPIEDLFGWVARQLGFPQEEKESLREIIEECAYITMPRAA
jgi:hypothetical protein